jgi:hypothetical protein
MMFTLLIQRRNILTVAISLLATVLLPGVLLAKDITLAWDPVTATNLSGYKVYYGRASRTYGAPISGVTATIYTIPGLGNGTFYFAVTAYNTNGEESGYSNEVSTTINRCDINGDGAQNILDLQTLINGILGVKPITTGDLNNDSRTDVLDLQIEANYLLGAIPCP